jgi:putative peptidoglycan lipid II flippase
VLILPAMAFLIVAASEIVGLFFQRGAFGPADTAATASILRIYALGLLGQTLVNIVVLPLFSIRHLRPTAWYPARAALIGLVVTVVVSLAALPPSASRAWPRATPPESPSWPSCCCAGPTSTSATWSWEPWGP